MGFKADSTIASSCRHYPAPRRHPRGATKVAPPTCLSGTGDAYVLHRRQKLPRIEHRSRVSLSFACQTRQCSPLLRCRLVTFELGGTRASVTASYSLSHMNPHTSISVLDLHLDAYNCLRQATGCEGPRPRVLRDTAVRGSATPPWPWARSPHGERPTLPGLPLWSITIPHPWGWRGGIGRPFKGAFPAHEARYACTCLDEAFSSAITLPKEEYMLQTMQATVGSDAQRAMVGRRASAQSTQPSSGDQA